MLQVEERNNRKITDFFSRKKAKSDKMEAKDQERQDRVEKLHKLTSKAPSQG